MTLPFDKITIYNFPYYVRVFFPDLFNLVYGVDYQIQYFDARYKKRTNEFRLCGESNLLRYKDFALQEQKNKEYQLTIYDIIDKNHDFHYVDSDYLFYYLLKNRHLEDYWVQSIFLKEL